MPTVVREALHKRNQWPFINTDMISFLLTLAAAAIAEQMAPARKGMLQCQMPDALFKTCASLSKLSQTGPDTYQFETEILIDPNGPVILTERNDVTAQGNNLCEVIRVAKIDSWTVKVGGAPATPAQAAKYRGIMKRRFASFEGKTICTTIVPNDQETLKVLATIGGKRVPAGDYDMIWVDPKDGWTVAR